MRTNVHGVTENAEFKIDPLVYADNHTHIFRKDICPCEDCTNKRNEPKEEDERDA